MNRFESDDDEALFGPLRSAVRYSELPAETDSRIFSTVMDHFDRTSGRLQEQESDTNAVVEIVRPKRNFGRFLFFAAAAASLLGMLFLLPVGNAYSFEKMLEAIQAQPLMRAVMRGQTKTAAIGWRASSVVAVETRDAVYWWDKDQHQTMKYDRASGDRAPVSDHSDVSNHLVALLNSIHDLPQDGSAKLRSESWREVEGLIELTVRLDVEPLSRELQFVFGLDSNSQLPQWVRIDSEPAIQVDLGYPDRGPTSLASLGVPLESLLKKDQEPKVASVESETKMVEPITTVEPETMEPDPDALENVPSDSPATVNVAASTSTSDNTIATRLAARRWQTSIAMDVPQQTKLMIDLVDRRLKTLWGEHELEPVETADSYELVRRLYLDLAGRVPLVSEVAKSKDMTQQELVEQLLRSRDFSTHLATVWSRLLLPESVDLDRFGGVEAFNRWLADQFRQNVTYDDLVAELLTVEGRVGDSGPVLFYSALLLKPEELAKQTSRVFLGARIDCAQCHDHPFDDWTQQDFWGYAAFFARISRPQGRMETLSPVLRVHDVAYGDVHLPNTQQVVPPRFLGGELLSEQPGEALRRQELAQWLTGSRQFARATVNHLWTHFFGTGFVDPSDDFGAHNLAIAPELLDELAEFLITNDYDLRELVRVITSSRAYRLSSRAPDDQPERTRHFAQMNTKWLTAEQLYDALTTAARSTQPVDTGMNMTSIERFGLVSRDAFVEKFKAPRGAATQYQAGIPQSLALMNGALTLQATEGETSGMMKALTAPFFTDKQRMEKIFLAVLGRPSDLEEQQTILPMLESAESKRDKQHVLSDLFWALLNTAEFATNH